MKVNLIIEVDEARQQAQQERRVCAADIEEFWRSLPEDETLAGYRIFRFPHNGKTQSWSLDLPFMRALWDAINNHAQSPH